MNKISYYIYMAVLLTVTIFVSCAEEDAKSQPLYTGELSIYDFAPITGKGGTQLLINGEQFPMNASDINVEINGVKLSILKSNEEQLLVEVPDNETIDKAQITVTVGSKTVKSKANFAFQKAAITSYSPAIGKVGTVVRVYVENLPVEIVNASATYNEKKADCTFDGEEGCFLVTIPEIATEGIHPIILQFNGRTLSTGDFEYDSAPIFERTIITLPGSDIFTIKSSIWEERRGGIAVDNNGNVYFAEPGNVCIRKIASDGTIGRAAGIEVHGDPDWNMNWSLTVGGSYNAEVRPTDVKVDSKGNMYATDDWIGGTIRFEPDGKAHYLGNQVGVSLAIDEGHNRIYIRRKDETIILKNLDSYGNAPDWGQEIVINGGIGGMDVDKRTGDLYVTNH